MRSCLYHAVVLKRKRFWFTVTKGSSTSIGKLIYATLLEFPEQLRNSYMFCIDSIRCMAFYWVRNSASAIPVVYEELLLSSHATDLYSYASFYFFLIKYKENVRRFVPLPSAGIIWPTVFVYWNALKRGVDECSRAPSILLYTNVAENPIFSVIRRLICAQIYPTAILHRLSFVNAKGSWRRPCCNGLFTKRYTYI